MKIEHKHILSFFKEIIVVVSGVLIAVSISNYKQKVDNEDFMNKTLAAVHNEISESKVDVERVMQKHLNLIDSIRTSLENEDESINQMLIRVGGIQFVEPANIGLRFFVSNKAELVDYEVISQLSQIETTTRVLDKKMDRLLDYSYGVLEKRDRTSKLKLLAHLGNVIDSENSLLILFDSFVVDEDASAEEEQVSE